MAIIKLTRPLNVEDIYCRVTCPECDNSYTMHMKGSNTRKNCPGCNRLTFVFQIQSMRGAVIINAVTVGRDNTPQEYIISPEDVEIAGQ